MSSINITKQADVATITLNNPDKHNAFDDTMIAEMSAAFTSVDKDDSVRVVVLASAGKNFSAGGDLNWMKRMVDYDYDENLRDAQALATMLNTLNNLSKPTIARVQGAAYGGAVGLVSCCDMAVASHAAKFCLSEVKIGLIPATISPYVIDAIGSRAARRYFLSAEIFSAQQALQLGLVSEVCEHNEMDQKLNTLISALLSNSPAAITASKQLIKDVSGAPIDKAMISETSKRIADVRTSSEGQEGLSAFLEKRQPAWLKQSKHKGNE